MNKLGSFTLVLSTTAMLAGCAASPEGDWQSDTKLGNGEKNEMSLTAGDMRGSATLWATRAGESSFTEFEFDVEWQEKRNGEYEFDLECDSGPCEDGANDFEMECDFIETTTGEKLDCEGDGRWSNAVLQWERDE